MPQVAQLIGGAGTGKTTELLNIMEKALAQLGDPRLVGFVSFTRAARAEAAERAASRFNVPLPELEREGWFRTIHSICYRQLQQRADGMLTDNAESRRWLQDALQADVNLPESIVGDLEAYGSFTGHGTDAQQALALWGRARNRLEPLRASWEEAAYCDPRTPCYGDCEEVVERYEQAKRLDGRSDFTDLLTRFAGWRCDLEGPVQVDPEGDVPALPCWFFDEQQDASALLDAVCKRLIAAPTCHWVYVVGDPFQAIYGWAGADPSYFTGWPAAKRRVMPKSHRCPQPILELGENILRSCSDYWDRQIAPADHAGEVERHKLTPALFAQIQPRESWLILARTNQQARHLAGWIDRTGLPWLPTKGHGTWDAPVRATAIQALRNLQAGAWIGAAEWLEVLKFCPAKAPGEEGRYLEYGTKARFAKREPAAVTEEYGDWLRLPDLRDLGATEAFDRAVQSGAWVEWMPGARAYLAAVDRWGQEAVDHPLVRIGTIHSVKGREADNVMVLTSLTAPCRIAAQSQRGHDEEQRVFYVAVTRAKHRLVVVDEAGAQFRKAMPI